MAIFVLGVSRVGVCEASGLLSARMPDTTSVRTLHPAASNSGVNLSMARLVRVAGETRLWLPGTMKRRPKLRRQRERSGDRAEREIAEVEHDVVGRNGLVPATSQLGIHLLHAVEWAVRDFDDSGVAEEGVARHEVDLVEVERRVFRHRRARRPCLVSEQKFGVDHCRQDAGVYRAVGAQKCDPSWCFEARDMHAVSLDVALLSLLSLDLCHSDGAAADKHLVHVPSLNRASHSTRFHRCRSAPLDRCAQGSRCRRARG